MGYEQGYLAQVELLLTVLPLINEHDCFALKGGTAINLFLRDLPRLSIDIDLAYIPIEPRELFLVNITSALKNLARNLQAKSMGAYKINEIFSQTPARLTKLLVYNDNAQIIIEPNFVTRGSVFECEQLPLCPKAQNQFLKYFKIKTLSLADLYGGKICATLARQHPRDLFDVKLLLENEGITDSIRQAFVVYLASNSRPIHELLNPEPNLQNMRKLFEDGFVGMTQFDVLYDQLIETRYVLIKQILTDLTSNEREFLLSVKNGHPKWELLPIKNIDKLPAIEWKTLNIKKMNNEKHQDALNKLKKVLEL
jgi:predicted nucleotidyltransferase component of viral defense system